jgi:DNA-binding NarL/FixJ family response regulator
MIKVGIIEDNIFMLKSYRDYLNSTEGIMVVFSFVSMEEARTQFEKKMVQAPDIILLDIILPGESGSDGIPYLKTHFKDAKIVILSGYNDEKLLMHCIKLGASGYALKSAKLADLIEVIKQTLKTGAFLDEQSISTIIKGIQSKKSNSFRHLLSFREKEIVALVEKGFSYKQMSEHLFITTYAINYHLKNIYKKLGIHSKSELLSRIMEDDRN